MCLGVMGVLVVVAPLLLLAAAVVGLSSHGPLGAVAALLLVVACVVLVRLTARQALRWWATTAGRWPH